jgi:2-phospho-L-lactate/phosphoenolpyruvate guanylyltransferase
MIVAAIPVKKLSEAKSRLSIRLSSQQRTSLVLTLLERTVAAVRGSGMVARIALATPEPALADSLQTELISDPGSLNGALQNAASWATRASATQLLILPGDLPLISPGAVEALLHSAGDAPGITITATRDGGTGALLLAPPNVVPPVFGELSFQHHLDLARRKAVAVTTPSIDAFTRDLDTVEDLEAFGPQIWGVPT